MSVPKGKLPLPRLNELKADGERIVETKGACILGQSWFKNHTAERLYPDALIDGQPATVD